MKSWRSLLVARPCTPVLTARPLSLRALAAAAVAAALLPAAVIGVAAPAAAATSYVVAPWGSDSAAGSPAHPFRTVRKGMSVLRAGNTLVVRGGRYHERIKLTPRPGTSTARITVVNAPGERTASTSRGARRTTGTSTWSR
jgi:hypothetical protein